MVDPGKFISVNRAEVDRYLVEEVHGAFVRLGEQVQRRAAAYAPRWSSPAKPLTTGTVAGGEKPLEDDVQLNTFFSTSRGSVILVGFEGGQGEKASYVIDGTAPHLAPTSKKPQTRGWLFFWGKRTQSVVVIPPKRNRGIMHPGISESPSGDNKGVQSFLLAALVDVLDEEGIPHTIPRPVFNP